MIIEGTDFHRQRPGKHINNKMNGKKLFNLIVSIIIHTSAKLRKLTDKLKKHLAIMCNYQILNKLIKRKISSLTDKIVSNYLKQNRNIISNKYRIINRKITNEITLLVNCWTFFLNRFLSFVMFVRLFVFSFQLYQFLVAYQFQCYAIFLFEYCYLCQMLDTSNKLMTNKSNIFQINQPNIIDTHRDFSKRKEKLTCLRRDLTKSKNLINDRWKKEDDMVVLKNVARVKSFDSFMLPEKSIVVQMVQIFVKNEKNPSMTTNNLQNLSQQLSTSNSMPNSSNTIPKISTLKSQLNNEIIEEESGNSTKAEGEIKLKFITQNGLNVIDKRQTIISNKSVEMNQIEPNSSNGCIVTLLSTENANPLTTIKSASTSTIQVPNFSAVNLNSNKSSVIISRQAKLAPETNDLCELAVNTQPNRKQREKSIPNATNVITIDKVAAHRKNEFSWTGLQKGVIASATNKATSTLVQSSKLIRIVNAPAKTIVSNSQPSLFVQKIGKDSDSLHMTNVPDKQTVTLISSKSNQNTGDAINKCIGNNLFLCKTEGKIIRLTPLVSSNCFSSNSITVTTSTLTNSMASNILGTNKQETDDTTSLFTSPPPLNFNSFKSSLNSRLTIASAKSELNNSINTRSIYEETYAKFLQHKEIVKDSTSESSQNMNAKKILIKETTDTKPVNTMKVLTSSVSGRIQPINIHRQDLTQNKPHFLATKTISPNPATSSSDLFKNMPQTLQHFSRQTDTVNDTKLKNASTHSLVPTVTSSSVVPPLNRIRITFPLISSSARNAKIPSLRDFTLKPNNPRPQQLLITSSNILENRVNQLNKLKVTPIQSTNTASQSQQGNVDTSTLEQLREFDMVLEQVKERSTNTTATTTITTSSNLSTNSCDILTPSGSNGINHKLNLINNRQPATGILQKINLAIIQKNSDNSTMQNQFASAKKVNTPFVVVGNCPNNSIIATQPNNNVIMSPQNSNTIERTPLTINTDTITSSNSGSKYKTTVTSKVTPHSNDQPALSVTLQKLQNSHQSSTSSKQPHKLQEDEQTVQRIYDILAQYAEQISSSPDLNNKPAPRRRSNLISIQTSPTNSTSSKTSAKITSTTTSMSSNLSEASLSPPTLLLARKRQKSISNSMSDDPDQNDFNIDHNDTSNDRECIGQPPNDKKRRLSTNTKNSDYILTSMPPLLTQNQIVLTTGDNSNNLLSAQPMSISIDSTNKSTDLPNANRNFFITKNTSKIEPLTIGIPKVSNADVQTNSIFIPRNYLLPMGILKYDEKIQSTDFENEREKFLRPNLTAVMFRTTNLQNSSNESDVIKSESTSNAGKQNGNVATVQTAVNPASTSTILLRALSSNSSQGSKITQAQATADAISAYTRTKQDHQIDNTLPKYSSQIFQSNRGIIILDNKYATLLTTNYTPSTNSLPKMTYSKISNIDFISDTKSTGTTCVSSLVNDTIDSSNFKNTEIKMETNSESPNEIKMNTKIDDQHGFSLYSPIKPSQYGGNELDIKVEHENTFEHSQSLSSPMLFSNKSDKNTDNIINSSLTGCDVHSNERNICKDDVREFMTDNDNDHIQYHDHLYQHEKCNEQIIIIDKNKSDTLTLNAVSNRRNEVKMKSHNDVERELRLQKSLSEECEDLGVDEPSTSELFPEAELSFDNNSPIAFEVSASGPQSTNKTIFEFSNRFPTIKTIKKAHTKFGITHIRPFSNYHQKQHIDLDEQLSLNVMNENETDDIIVLNSTHDHGSNDSNDADNIKIDSHIMGNNVKERKGKSSDTNNNPQKKSMLHHLNGNVFNNNQIDKIDDSITSDSEDKNNFASVIVPTITCNNFIVGNDDNDSSTSYVNRHPILLKNLKAVNTNTEWQKRKIGNASECVSSPTVLVIKRDMTNMNNPQMVNHENKTIFSTQDSTKFNNGQCSIDSFEFNKSVRVIELRSAINQESIHKIQIAKPSVSVSTKSTKATSAFKLNSASPFSS